MQLFQGDGGLLKYICICLICCIYLVVLAYTYPCPSGCFCPEETSATCCLFPNSAVINENSLQTCILSDGYRIIPAIQSTNQWPLHDKCFSNWTNLRIEIVDVGWPPQTSKQACTGSLSQLAISSDMSGNGRLKDLFERDINLFFPKRERSKLEHFIVENTALEAIENGFSERLGVAQLKTLAIRNNRKLKAVGLGTAWMAGLPRLTSLDLSGNQLDELFFVRWGIPKIRQGINPSHLQTLNLSNNILKVLQEKSFSNFPYLENLYLANNRINTLPLSVFDGLTRLKNLDLSGNYLTLYGMTTFSSQPFHVVLPDLETLSLSDNPLLRDVDSDSQLSQWWLSSGCPNTFSRLSLNNIEILPSSWSKHGAYPLPLVPWKKCRGLLEVSLKQNPDLECLSGAWLQLSQSEVAFPTSPKFLTSATRICSSSDSDTNFAIFASSPLPRIVHNSESRLSNLFGLISDTDSSDTSGIRILTLLLIGGLLLLIILFLIMVIFLCRRKHSHHGRSRRNKSVPIDDFEKLPDSVFETQKSGYFSDPHDEPRPAFPVNTMQRMPTQTASLIPIPRTDSGLLYNEHGVPVFRIVQQSFDGQSSVTGNSEMRPLLLSDGTEAYYPASYGVSLISLSGPNGVFDSTNLISNTHRLPNPPVSHNRNSLFSLQTSDLPMKYGRGPKRRQHQNKPTQNSSVSCKSTSLSSFCTSVHSGNAKKNDPSSVFSISTAPLEADAQLMSSSDPDSMELKSKQKIIKQPSFSSSDCSTRPSPNSSDELSPVIVEEDSRKNSDDHIS